MSKFVIVRTDGKYVAPPGLESSYTPRLEEAWIFSDRQTAEAQRCVENETVRAIDDILSVTRYIR